MKENKVSFSDGKDKQSSRRKQGKKRLANFQACKADLHKEFTPLFRSFDEALEKTNAVLSNFQPCHRSRTFEASTMQSSFAEAIMGNFGSKAFFGRWKRLILRTEGYCILFKKLNGKGCPMNIKTLNVQGILSQHQVLDLFADSDYNDEPILYFGYQKDRFGRFVNPQLVYIDDGKVIFKISKADVATDLSITPALEKKQPSAGVSPTIKNNNNLKKSN